MPVRRSCEFINLLQSGRKRKGDGCDGIEKIPHFSVFFQDMKPASAPEREAIQRSCPERQSDTENLKTGNKSQSLLRTFAGLWVCMIFIYFDSLFLRFLSVSGLQTTLCASASILIHVDSLIYIDLRFASFGIDSNHWNPWFGLNGSWRFTL